MVQGGLGKRFEIKSQCVGPAALGVGGKSVASTFNGLASGKAVASTSNGWASGKAVARTSDGLASAGAGAVEGPAATATNGEAMIEGTEGRSLNRVVRCTPDGWEVEPDQRHADVIVRELALTGANGVTTPGENEQRPQEGCG